MTYEAESSGVLRRLVAEGETVALGGPIAELLVAGQPLEPVERERSRRSNRGARRSRGGVGRESGGALEPGRR